MTDLDRWLAANDRFLAASLAWLRQRLDALAPSSSPLVRSVDSAAAGSAAATSAVDVGVRAADVPLEPTARPRSLLTRVWSVWELDDAPSAPALPPPALGRPQAPAPDTPAPPQPIEPGTPSPLQLLDPTSPDPPPALALLARRLGLTPFESHVLLLCAAMELDTRMGALCARAQQDPSRPHPTFALALTLFDSPAWDVLSPERPLRYWRLIEINQPGAQPLVTSALKADERIVNYLKGLNYLDDRLAPLVAPVPHETAPLPPSQQETSDAIAEHLGRARESAHPPLLQLLGADSQSKLLVAEYAASRLGLMLHRIAAEALPTQGPDLETFARLWQRESALLPLALYVDAADVDRASGPTAAAVQRLCRRGVGIVLLDTRQPWPDLGRGALSFDVAKPMPAEQYDAWRATLGTEPEVDDAARRLAGQFNFNVPSIQVIAATARARVGDDLARLGEAVWGDSLRHARPALDQLAQPLEAKAHWDTLELPPTEKALLRQIADQVGARLAVYDTWGFRDRMNRGLGISVLFAGESGTGKTMAAEVLANELSLMLYRIDLSSVVSKYIGETERNLRKLFDAAEDGGAMLFFDEADALFGKRSEVKDSHDRYANIEINYLLQRMETYRGLAILATNMKSALDSAFLRRLRFIVNFPFPGHAERLAIWQKAFPPRAPVAALDYGRLARFNLTGGSIHNIALNAAFLAAHAGEPISMRLVLDAVRNEYRKLEKPVNEADFRWLEPAASNASRSSEARA